MRFSDKFKLNKGQIELDFVDIPLNTDLPLFVDPYAISIEDNDWFNDCNDMIIDYFQLLISFVRKSDKNKAIELLSHLNEPNEVHLGLSTGKPEGRGVGHNQSLELYERFLNSKAVQTGKLQDISECELVIPGISRDKISDMTINIIKKNLFEYTKTQCDLMGINTEKISGGFYWDTDLMKWSTGYFYLPVTQNNKILLIPKIMVRYDLSYNSQEYYNRFVLDFLSAEHSRPGDSLAHVLKSGKKKGQIKVFKNKLKKKYPLSKEYLYDFSNDHPDILKKYKISLKDKTYALTNKEIERKQPYSKDISYISLKKELNNIPTGIKNANNYHRKIAGILLALFYPELWNPTIEQEINDGRKRIDIVFSNNSKEGFFHNLSVFHQIKCPYIFIECKNYSNDPKNPELDQLQGRLSDKRGLFGILVCRNISNKTLLIKRCRDILNSKREYIIYLDDSDINSLLDLKEVNDSNKFYAYLDDRLKEIIS